MLQCPRKKTMSWSLYYRGCVDMSIITSATFVITCHSFPLLGKGAVGVLLEMQMVKRLHRPNRNDRK